MRQNFNLLAARVLAGEASSAEQDELNAILMADPELQSRFQELQAAHNSLRDIAPLAAALDSSPSIVPPARLAQLQKVVQQNFPNRPLEQPVVSLFDRCIHWIQQRFAPILLVSATVALAIVAVLLFRPRPGSTIAQNPEGYLIPRVGSVTVLRQRHRILVNSAAALNSEDEIQLSSGTQALMLLPSGSLILDGPRQFKVDGLAVPPQTNSNKSLRLALFTPTTNLAPLLLATRSASPIRLYSPLGATDSLTPLFFWNSQPGKTYDLHITDEINSKTPPWEASAVKSPLALTNIAPSRPLLPNNLYRLEISITDDRLSSATFTFRTTASLLAAYPSSDAGRLIRAFEILSGSSGQTGDALAALLSLTEPASQSELALRLKLFAFGQAGYKPEFDAVAAELVRLP